MLDLSVRGVGAEPPWSVERPRDPNPGRLFFFFFLLCCVDKIDQRDFHLLHFPYQLLDIHWQDTKTREKKMSQRKSVTKIK